MPKVGQHVLVTAHRKHGLGGWRALKVDHVNEGEDWDQPEEKSSSDEDIIENTYAEEKIDVDAVVGIVKDIDSDKGYIESNNGIISFCLVDVIGFVPQNGDWVTAKLSQEDRNFATLIKPLREKEFVGRINSVQREYGYIDQEIYFTFSVCADKFEPKRGDGVRGRAMECSRGKYSTPWRAISVELWNEPRSKPDVLTRYLSFYNVWPPCITCFLQ